jgi:tRNA A37 threonylcarbamoyladenosine modification protein TsaB
MNTLFLDSTGFFSQHLRVWDENGALREAIEVKGALTEALFPTLQRLWSIHQPCRLLVNSGPGSYAGTRAGQAAMEGLAFAANLPLESINAFALLHHAQQAVLPDIGNPLFLVRIDHTTWQTQQGEQIEDASLSPALSGYALPSSNSEEKMATVLPYVFLPRQGKPSLRS